MQVFVPMGPNGRPGGAAPVITLQPNANGQPTVYNFVPNGEQQPAAPTGPTTTFGATGAPAPGMIQAAAAARAGTAAAPAERVSTPGGIHVMPGAPVSTAA